MSTHDPEKLAAQQHEYRVEENSAHAATQMAATQASHYIQNPEFLKQLQDPDVDTDLYDWLEDELAALLSGAHILGQRGEHYEDERSLLNRNVVERLIAERTPGRLLAENPRMYALAQGIQGTAQYPDPTTNPKYREPLTSRKRRVIRDVAEVLTTRQSLSIGGAGVDAVATATIENRSLSNEEAEATGALAKAKGVLR